MPIKVAKTGLGLADDIQKSWSKASKSVAQKIGTQFVREHKKVVKRALKLKGTGRIKAVRRYVTKSDDGFGYGLVMADMSSPSEVQEAPTTLKAHGKLLVMPFLLPDGTRDPAIVQKRGGLAVSSSAKDAADLYARKSKKTGKTILFRKAATASEVAVAKAASVMRIPTGKVRGVAIAALVPVVRTKVRLGMFDTAQRYADKYGDALLDAILEA